MIDVNLDIDYSENDTLKNVLTDQRVRVVINRSLKKTMVYVARQTATGLSQELDVNIKSLRELIIFSLTNIKNGKASLWIGLNDLHANSVGKVRQTSQGVSVRGHRFKGAFVGKPFGGRSFITAFRRASSKHASKHDEVRNKPYEKNNLTPKDHSLWPRYPLNKVGVRIEGDAEMFLSKQELLINKRFNVILQQELNYEFNVKN